MTAVCECGPDLVAEGRDGVCLRCRRLVAFDGSDGGLGCLVVLALGFMALVCVGVVAFLALLALEPLAYVALGAAALLAFCWAWLG